MENVFYEILPENESVSEIKKIIELEPGVTLEKIGEVKSVTESTEMPEKLIVGDYKEAMEHWHMQLENDSCVITQEISVAEQLLGKDFSEEKMLEFSKLQGWYDGNRISESDCGKFLEYMGINVEKSENIGLNDLVQELSDGSKAICGVNVDILYHPELFDLPGARANHVVQVIGVDMTESNDIKIILNDSGIPDGRGIRVDAETFMKAWKASDNFAVIARKGV